MNLIYCRPSSINPAHATTLHGWKGDIWPALYEEAFAKWITGNKADRPDMRQTAHGDPVKAMAQLTDTVPHYFPVLPRRGRDSLEVVCAHCTDLRATAPMVAWTYTWHDRYRTYTLVANMAYSVLGWASSPSPSSQDSIKQYLILRHPWGVTEPWSRPRGLRPRTARGR